MTLRPETVGDRVRRLRKAKGWTQKGLSDEIGRTRLTVQRIEAGGSTSVEIMRAVARALDVRLGDLLDGTGEEVA